MPKVVKSSAREIILKVKEFCEAEPKNQGVLIPLNNVRKRVATITEAKLSGDTIEFCGNLTCGDEEDIVCGFRAEGDGFRLKLFKSECDLLKYGCNENEGSEYGLINKEYCDDQSEKRKSLADILLSDCICDANDTKELCAIRKDEDGFRVRWFENKCQLIEHNCKNNIKYNETDDYICKQSIGEIIRDKSENKSNENVTNIVVVNTRMFYDDDMNDTIDKFFAASHVFDLPIKEMETRRRLIKNAGPVKVFVPWIVIPKNKSNDKWHVPTLSSCYHKCPTKCPDTYAPVCGVPGIVAREPSLMFQNHCFMDVAQCKMYWEDKSSTAHSSSYIETSFVFCMGDEMNAVYRFLPAVRTLQKMGRLKKKGKFRQKLRNFRYINNFRSGVPKFMG